jgi:hypothetical protein
MIFFAKSLQAVCIRFIALRRSVGNHVRKTRTGWRRMMTTLTIPISAFAIASKDDCTTQGRLERASKLWAKPARPIVSRLEREMGGRKQTYEERRDEREGVKPLIHIYDEVIRAVEFGVPSGGELLDNGKKS